LPRRTIQPFLSVLTESRALGRRSASQLAEKSLLRRKVCCGKHLRLRQAHERLKLRIRARLQACRKARCLSAFRRWQLTAQALGRRSASQLAEKSLLKSLLRIKVCCGKHIRLRQAHERPKLRIRARLQACRKSQMSQRLQALAFDGSSVWAAQRFTACGKEFVAENIYD